MPRDGAMVLVTLMVLLLVFVVGAGVGVWAASAYWNDQVTQATRDKDTCVNTANAQTAAIDKLQQHLQDEKDKAAQAKAKAAAALAARPATVAGIEQHALVRAEAVRKQGNEGVDCAGLARMPVCPAVAGRLWPHASTSAGAPANR